MALKGRRLFLQLNEVDFVKIVWIGHRLVEDRVSDESEISSRLF